MSVISLQNLFLYCSWKSMYCYKVIGKSIQFLVNLFPLFTNQKLIHNTSATNCNNTGNITQTVRDTSVAQTFYTHTSVDISYKQ